MSFAPPSACSCRLLRAGAGRSAADAGAAVDAAAAPTRHATTKKPAPGKDTVDLQDIRSFTARLQPGQAGLRRERRRPPLMQAAIRGLLAGLDPHSEYLDRKQIDDLTEDTTGSYNGLGIEVVQVEGTLRVVAPIDDSPAERAGIKAGDTIVRIDGKAVQSDDLDGAVGRLRGKVGIGDHARRRAREARSIRSTSS